MFSPSNKIHREVGRLKDLSAPFKLERMWKEVVFLIKLLAQNLSRGTEVKRERHQDNWCHN
jgi:hypothetical protein